MIDYLAWVYIRPCWSSRRPNWQCMLGAILFRTRNRCRRTPFGGRGKEWRGYVFDFLQRDRFGKACTPRSIRRFGANCSRYVCTIIIKTIVVIVYRCVRPVLIRRNWVEQNLNIASIEINLRAHFTRSQFPNSLNSITSRRMNSNATYTSSQHDNEANATYTENLEFT